MFLAASEESTGKRAVGGKNTEVRSFHASDRDSASETVKTPAVYSENGVEQMVGVSASARKARRTGG